MSHAEMLFIICYDVADDGRRRRIARVLEDTATRVQKSVFEIRATEAKARSLTRRASSHLDVRDSLRLYAVDRAGRKRCRTYGPGPRVEEQQFLIL